MKITKPPKIVTVTPTAKTRVGKSTKSKRKERTNTASAYKVHIYDAGVVKWLDKHQTRILSVENGMLAFEHKRPYSKLLIQEIVPLSQVVVYGHEEMTEDGAPGWVFVKRPRIVVDAFTALAWKRKGSVIEFDLGGGNLTVVNAGADFEIVGVSAE